MLEFPAAASKWVTESCGEWVQPGSGHSFDIFGDLIKSYYVLDNKLRPGGKNEPFFHRVNNPVSGK